MWFLQDSNIGLILLVIDVNDLLNRVTANSLHYADDAKLIALVTVMRLSEDPMSVPVSPMIGSYISTPP